MTPCREWQGKVNNAGYGQRYIKGRRQPVFVHRWVVEEIDGPIPDGMVVMHLCHNKRCYRYDHLKVGTASENTQMSKHLMKRITVPVGAANPRAILTEDQVREIFTSTESRAELARQYGVNWSTIHRIKNGVRWSHITKKESR